MTERIFNFSAGPAVLPLPVLEKAQSELVSLPGVGMSIMEISHRSKAFDEIHMRAENGIRELMGVPENYHILFLQGGASLQFSMIPMNLLSKGASADYIVTGSWGKKAVKEAKREGTVNIAATTADGGFTRVPAQDELKLDANAAYVHFTSNETIEGVEFKQEPEAGEVPLVCDASSDIMSRRVAVGKYGLIYAGAQKNMGPSGLTVVIVRDDLLGHALAITPSAFNYQLQAENDSMYNTPPTYAIYIAGLVCEHVKAHGGLTAMEAHNRAKARLLYDFLDGSRFFRNEVARDDRSLMNVPFKLRDESLNDAFLKGAQERGMVQLKGHRSVGGMRASIYNAMPIAGVQALVAYLQDFERQHG